jgi:hypothetical protein
VIHAGAPQARWALSRALAPAPVQRLGDWSYAIYLWHWPLIVLAPFALARPLDDATRAAILGATVVLAALTKVLVEDPFRRGRLLAGRPPRWTFAAATAAAAAVVLVGSKGTEQVQAEIRRAQELTVATEAAPPRCFGAAARAPGAAAATQRCGRWWSRRRSRCAGAGTPAASASSAWRAASACRRPEAREHVALLGDSHAAHWRAALAVVARRRGWHGLSVTRTSCAFSPCRSICPSPSGRAAPAGTVRCPGGSPVTRG